MRKKQTRKDQRIERGKAAIEYVLRDLALGASHGYEVDDEAGLMGAFDPEGFGGFLAASARRFRVGTHADENATWEFKHAMDFENFENFETFSTMAAYLYSVGVRER